MKVFISYSSIDEDQARLVANILDDIDVQYFFDKKDISWGNVVNSDISEGISESNALILILSPASIKSQWVSFEIGFATALNKKVLPYLTHPSIDVPGFLQRLKYITKKEVEKIFELINKEEW